MVHSLGCVSFLNSKPLIDSVVGVEGVRVEFAVPAELLGLFEKGLVSAALMSVVDYQASATELLLLPAGMIGSDGPTLTVRIYSRVPAGEIRVLHGDTDSHTSVILAQVILRERYGVVAEVVPLKAREGVHAGGGEAMLLIGDKVINASPDAGDYPYQLDLGEEWKALTGLPFVFAMWMIRRDRVAAEGAAIARILDGARREGEGRTEVLLDRYAAEKGWPRELARKYFTEYLRYEVTAEARAGLARFFEMAGRLGLLEIRRQVAYFEIPA